MTKSCGETVLKVEAELDVLPLKSIIDEIAGEENADAPPSKVVNSSRSTSDAMC